MLEPEGAGPGTGAARVGTGLDVEMRQAAPVEADSGGDPAGRVGRYRYLAISVMLLATFMAAFDRIAVSLLLVDASFLDYMGLQGSPERQGMVMSASLLPYALSNIFIGPAADRWGPRRVLAVMAALWSATAVLLGSAGSYAVLLLGRVVRGTAEGPLFPVANRYVRNWFPPSERGGANAIWTAGQRLGLAISVPLLAATIAAFGWRSSFYMQAVFIAIAVLPAVWFLTADRPEEMPRVGEVERLHIARGRLQEKERSAGSRQDLRALLANYRYWLAVIYHFAVLAVFFGLVTWLPKYLKEARDFDVAQMVLFASLPHIVSTITSVPAGFLSDRVGGRAAFCAGSLAAASVSVWIAAIVPDPIVSALVMMVGFGMWGIGSPIYYAVMQRIIPGSIMATGIGIDNGLANFGSALAPTVVGVLIGATGSYLAGLLFLAGVGAVGSIAAVVLAVQRY